MTDSQEPKTVKKSVRHPRWWRVARTILITVTVLVVLVSIAIGGAVWMLTPERLTPMVSRMASDNLNADVNASRIELTWWSTWPHLCLEIDSLEIVSHSMDALPDTLRSQLPSDADTLLRLPHMSGAINLASLLKMNIEVRDARIVRPWINLVAADSLHANYMITEPAAEEDTASVIIIPPLAIDRFEIEGPAKIRYASVADSTDIALTIHNIGLNAHEVPVYSVTTSGRMNARMASLLPSYELPLSIDGNIAWDSRTPMAVNIKDMTIGAGALRINTALAINMESDPVINTLDLQICPTSVDSLLGMIPAPYNDLVKGISCNGLISADMKLLSPFNLATDSLPDALIGLKLQPGQVAYGMMRLRNLETETDITLSHKGLDATVVNINNLRAYGPIIDARIKARIENIISDPKIDGKFSGMLNLTRLGAILSRHGVTYGMTLGGTLRGNADYRMRLSDLNPQHFHRTRLSGNLTLSDFTARDSAGFTADVDKVHLKFGTSTSLNGENGRIDSVLTVSMAFDTARIATPDLMLSVADVRAGIGAENRSASLDTNTILPIGAKMMIGLVDYKSKVDSSRIIVRKIYGGTMLRQFAKGTGRVPEMGLKLSTEMVIMIDKAMRVAMREGQFDLMAHLNSRSSILGPRTKARVDSLRKLHPSLSEDSLVNLAMSMWPQRQRMNSRQDEGERLNLALDNTTAGIVRRLDLQGSVKAKSIGLFTPAFPLRSRFRNMECDFTTDSILFHRMDCKIGSSDFAVQGTVSNIKRTLTSAYTRRPLKIEFSMQSDSINVNEIMRGMMRGAAYTDTSSSTIRTDANASDEEIQKAVEEAADGAMGALVVPSNIEATFQASANNITYGDVQLKDFDGTLLVNRGAVKLENMSAASDVGTASLNALYYAPADTSIMFGMGLKLHDFHIDKVIDLIPQIDSLMPIMSTMGGVIDADLTAATRIDSVMNIDMTSLKAMLKLSGDSLVLLDEETFKTMAKWLMFKDKKKNMIRHMDVALSVENSMMQLYPFSFDFDRYKIGVMGGNDLAMNLNYHVSVMKSPLPFKFGINITGPADNMKIRVGKARMKENMVQNISISDTTRINFVEQLDRLFRRGAAVAGRASDGIDLKIQRHDDRALTTDGDSISHTDSLTLIKEGLIAAPVERTASSDTTSSKKNKRKKK